MNPTGAGIRRDGRSTDRSTTCFFGGLCATTSALEQTSLEPKLSQWLACEMQDAPSDGLDLGGVNNLRAIGEWLLQDAQSDGLDGTYMIIALAWWQWTHTGNLLNGHCST